MTDPHLTYLQIINGWKYPDYNSETTVPKWAFVPFKIWQGWDEYGWFFGVTVLNFECEVMRDYDYD